MEPLTIERLAALLTDPKLLPSDTLERNAVGNLMVRRNGKYIGYIDLRIGVMEIF